MLCLITRIKVTRLSTLVRAIGAYLRMKRQARGSVPGLIEVAMLIRPRLTIVIISVWKDASAMAEFNSAVPGHPLEVFRMRRAHAEVWSGLFKFVGISPSARAWPDISTETLPSARG